MRDQAVFRNGDTDRTCAAGVLEQNGASVCFRVVNLHDCGACGFMGSIQYDDVLSWGKFHPLIFIFYGPYGKIHIIKVILFAGPACGTYKQLVDIH